MRRPLRALLTLSVSYTLLACHQSSSDAESLQSGEQIFLTVCSKCHGMDGKGGVAAGGTNAPRNFCDAAFQASRSDDDLRLVIQKGKGAMPPFGNMFSDSDCRGLVHKIRTFVPANVTHP